MAELGPQSQIPIGFQIRTTDWQVQLLFRELMILALVYVFVAPQVKHCPLLKITTLLAILQGEHFPIPLATIQMVEFVQTHPPFPSLCPVEKDDGEGAGQARHVEFTRYDIAVLQTQFPPVALLIQLN